MRNKLIAAIIVVCVLLAAAVGFLLFMERQPSEGPGQTENSTSEAASAPDGTSVPQETTMPEPTEETVGISLPTEDPNEVGPDMTFPTEDGTEPPAETADPDATWDPNENETPEMPA